MANLLGSRPRLAIVGASVRAAAQSASRAGLDVVAADLFADADLREVGPATQIEDYPSGFCSWLEGVEADAWMYTGGLERWPALIDRMARLKPLWGVCGAPLRSARDLQILHAALAEAGIGFPETRPSSASLPLDGSWLCKADRVWELDRPNAAAAGLERGAVYQRRLTEQQGRPASVVFVLGDTWARTVGVTEQLIGPRHGAAPFQYAGSVGPLEVGRAVERQLKRLRETLRHDFELRGVVGVDLWLSDDEFWVLEVNPRYTASVEVLELSGATPVLGLHSLAFANEAPANALPASQPARAPAKKQILYARRALYVPDSVQLGAASPGMGENAAWLADLPAGGQRFEPGDPILTVIARGGLAESSAFARFVAETESRLYGATPTPE
ncbi:ATP-grasp domain protein [Posidoniimonas corsicana]|uniref:ATP-grasp domain protein n=1 Tax=Posidoniimonas corsicana TaxID=1938618 RepID=A0A5C5VHF7_9BACT|nr:ATP-grasp domain-containing protein [Posidoniimonas corsicana]TWT38006.1 ATP-grasp domain protein [Posidoniimonas corsicana]